MGFCPRQLLAQQGTEQGPVDPNATVVFDKASSRNRFMKKLTRDRVVPIISARVSCEIVGRGVVGLSGCHIQPLTGEFVPGAFHWS